MLDYFKNSIAEKSFNNYGIYLGNGEITNNEGVSSFNVKLSPIIIQSIKGVLSCYPTKHYQEYRFIDKNTFLRICNGEREYYREHVFDTFIDDSLSEHLNLIYTKFNREQIERTQFPSKSNYHELSNDTLEYSVSDTITLLIRNSSKVYIEIKKDEYIDTTIETLESTLKMLSKAISTTDNDDN